MARPVPTALTAAALATGLSACAPQESKEPEAPDAQVKALLLAGPSAVCADSASAAGRKAFLLDNPELSNRQLAKVCPTLFPADYLNRSEGAKKASVNEKFKLGGVEFEVTKAALSKTPPGTKEKDAKPPPAGTQYAVIDLTATNEDNKASQQLRSGELVYVAAGDRGIDLSRTISTELPASIAKGQTRTLSLVYDVPASATAQAKLRVEAPNLSDSFALVDLQLGSSTPTGTSTPK